MVKKSIILLMSIVALAKISLGQQAPHCGTSEYVNDLKEKYPQIKDLDAKFEKTWKQIIIQKYGSSSSSASKTTSNSPIYDHITDSIYNNAISTKIVIPLVVHVIHDFGQADYLTDDAIYDMVKHVNEFYAAKNDASNTYYQFGNNLSSVIPPFIPYIGKANFEFRLAQKDPNGNATNGITRRQSYLAIGGNDQAKFDQWDPSRYVNIWFEAFIGQPASGAQILAYATPPSSAAQNPYYDGVISNASYADNSTLTIQHELGHIFNLEHTWGNTNNPGPTNVTCGLDDDGVDDTPPTTGHLGGCALYDTTCATGYMKAYSYDSSGHVGTAIVDYPDTVNEQNVMNYADCKAMFTKQQVLRMRAALNNSVGSRDNLWTASNLAITGVDKVNGSGNYVKTDLLPVPEFSVEAGTGGNRTYYMCATGTNKFLFKNRSWRDTITAVNWEFGNNATPGNSTDKNGTVGVGVTTPGWVTVKLTATGNHTGDSTISVQRVYAADPNYKLTPGYVEEFNTSENTDVDKWPIFNYYNNRQQWQVTNSTGFYDKSCMMYSGYDVRSFPTTLVGSPAGDRDDFFTPLFDLSNQGGDLSLNFMYAGAYRTTDPKLMKDTLEIAYSTSCGDSWTKLTQMTKGEMSTIGAYGSPFMPQWDGEWQLKSININNLAGKDKVFFRFRFKPGADNNMQGTGNNFYIDRINVSPFAAGINTLLNDNKTIVVAPNPASGSSYVAIKGRVNSIAQVQVTDITGKVVFSTQQTLNNQISRIEIPASAIAAKGMYMVHVINESQVHTEKLVAY